MIRSARIRQLILIVVIAAAVYALARSRRDFWDFEVYRTAAIRALAAEPLYRPEDGHYQFKYWPAFAFLAVPFALLPAEPAKVAWYSLSVLLLVGVVRQSIRMLPDRRTPESALALWAVLVTAKFIVKELVNGQTNLLLVALALAALAAGQHGRPLAAGALIGAAAFVKPYALLLIPWAAVTFGGLSLIAAGAVLAAGLLLPALAYGWPGNLVLLGRWYATVTETTTANLFFPENISYQSMWAKWIGEGPAVTPLALLTVCAALTLVAVAWMRRSTASLPGYLELSLLLLLMPLVSPQGWDYVLILAMPAYVCLIDRYRSMERTWRIAAVTGGLLTSFTIFDLLGRSLYASMMAAAVVPVGATLLLLCLLWLRWSKEA